MSLRSITAAWESGELVSCGFTSSEVIKAFAGYFVFDPKPEFVMPFRKYYAGSRNSESLQQQFIYSPRLALSP
jgi:hypothetical protein